MPRLPPSLIRAARRLDSNLSLLLPETRTLSSARAELRWLSETEPPPTPAQLTELCTRRGRFKYPLQYLLGDQPFGSLDIKVERGVLIPRSETEHYTTHLAELLKGNLKGARVLDLCTGTGCIALTLVKEGDAGVEAVGVDLNPKAVKLAEHNRVRNGITKESVRFVHGDIMRPIKEWGVDGNFDVVVSNPPYVAESEWWRSVGGSVRRWEPKEAVCAPENGDAFYGRILKVAEEVGARVVLVEVGGWDQAGRVKELWERMGGWGGVKVWRDYVGKGRSVVAWRSGGEWVDCEPQVWI